MKIITRYLLKEFIAPFFLGLFCFTFILLLNEIFLLTKIFVQKGISPRYLVELISYILPATLVLTIPIAVLVGLLLAFGNLSTQNEITAMKASGIGVNQLSVPVLTVCLLISVIDFGLMNFALPRANRAHLRLLRDIRARQPAMSLEDGVLMRELEREGKTWMYDRRDPVTGRLQQVLIFDEYADGKPRFIVANEADIGFREGYVNLTLYDGRTYEPHTTEAERYTTFMFNQKTISLDVAEALERSETDRGTESPRNMSLGQVSEYLRERRAMLKRERVAHETMAQQRNRPAGWVETRLRYRETEIARGRVEWHKKIAIPFACLAFGIIGVPLGISVRRSGRMVGLGVGLGLILVYYVLLQMGQTLGTRGAISPWFGIWLPNLTTAAAGILLLLRFVYGRFYRISRRS